MSSATQQRDSHADGRTEEENVLLEEGGMKNAQEKQVTSAPTPSKAQGASPISSAKYSAATVIIFWLIMSCSVILFNKHLYNGIFAHPLTLTSIHMCFATAATSVMRATGRLEVPRLTWSFWLKNILPIGLLYAGSLAFSNLAVMRLSVSFIQMVKALTPLMALGFSVARGIETPTRSLIAIVLLMCFGVTVASYGEIMFDTLGLTFQLVSITTEAARLVATQILVQSVIPTSNPLMSISLFAPPSFLFLLPVALYREPGALSSLLVPGVGMVVLANTLTAFTLNVAVVMLIERTSGLTLTLAGVIKDILIIVLSIWLFANPITVVQVVGYTLALYGLNMYHLYKAAVGKSGGSGSGAEPPHLPTLAKQAATDKGMLAMACGMAVLLLFAK